MADDARYAYSVARVRTVENRLLNKNKLDRMIDAKTSEEAFKVITDAGYGYSASETSSAFDYEVVLMEEQKKLYELLKEIAPDPQVFDMFLYKNDFQNAKVILKSEFLGQENNDLLVENGCIAPEKLAVMIRDRNLKYLPDIMADAILESIDTFNRTKDPQIIDLILDKATYLHMNKIAQSSNDKFLIGIVKSLIDFINIKNFIRIKKLNKSWDFLNKVLLPGGEIEIKAYIEQFEESLEKFCEFLDFTVYAKACREGIEEYIKTGSLTKFEKLSDDFMISYVNKAKYIALGIEPLVAYLIAKETEIKNIRIIMVGKINNISKEIIRERLRESYV